MTSLVAYFNAASRLFSLKALLICKMYFSEFVKPEIRLFAFSIYSFLFIELEKLFKKNYHNIILKKYKTFPQSAGGSYHRNKDLPKILKSWNENVILIKKILN